VPAADPEEQCAKLPRDRQADGVAVIDTATLKQTRLLKGVSDPERVEISRDGHSLSSPMRIQRASACWTCYGDASPPRCGRARA